jgi:HlyD family secretion protein
MRPNSRVFIIAAAAIVLLVLVAALRGRSREVRYQTVKLERGDVAEVVGATGTLQAVTTVQVGSQVSGTIQSLNADFNSVVKKGQVVARLDPSLFQARLGQAQANLASARANVERAQTSVDDTRQKYQRAQELAAQNLLPTSDLETARANYDGAVAQIKANQAAVTQAEASVNQADVDLGHTIIAAPIDGVVINRSVDVGQTVAASFQAPVLFVIANDLSRMQVNASIDEADIGRVRTGQDVSFRVDAYPDRTFAGRVEQVRLQPTTVQNVVSYNTIISAENPEGRLMPGMTATVSVVVRKAESVLRLPATALRFRPEGFDAVAWAAQNRPAQGAEAAPVAAGGERTHGGGESSRGMGGNPGAGMGRPPGAGAGRMPGPGGGARGDRAPSIAFVVAAGLPQPRALRLGLSDGQFMEVREGLAEGDQVIIGLDQGVASAGPARMGASPSTNPFAPARPPDRRRQ